MRVGEGVIRSRLAVPYGATISIEDGQKVEVGDLLFSWDPYSEPIVADFGGVVRFIDIVEEETMREELDESTGRRQLVIIEDRAKKLHPMIEIQDAKSGQKLREFIVPVGAQLTVRDGEEITPGATLAKIAREAYKTRDITGGLPRIAELFEARAEGAGGDHRGRRLGPLRRHQARQARGDHHPGDGDERVYEIPVGKHLRVHEGDLVRAGDRLSEGPVNPHDILRIKGPRAVQEYLLNEVQEVYRLQGVKINDKHIGVIVRQMLQKVRIVEPGETEFLEGETVDRMTSSR
jgi:DNA-directed RNA polymerase subunit beta'